MRKQKVETVQDMIFLSYSNLAMAHMAVERKQKEYDIYNYMIRAKLLKGFKKGTMNIRTIFDDEKVKLQIGNICNYCGSSHNLALDHIFSQKFGGLDDAENLIFACRSCNSSKGQKDLMEWMNYREKFLPLMIIRRYLKLIFKYCTEKELLSNSIKDLEEIKLPFRIELLPIKFPSPSNLILSIDNPTSLNSCD